MNTRETAFPRTYLLAIGVCIAAAVFFVYSSSLRNGFINLDDPPLIENNQTIRGMSAAHVRSAFTSYDPELYIPVTLLSYQIEYQFAGVRPFVLHRDSLLLHIANALLVAWIASMLLHDVWMGLFLGLLFGLHPQNTEAVVWASARKDLLSGFFFLASYGLYLKEGRRTLGSILLPLSVLLFGLGLLSKISIVMLPAVLLLTEWLQETRIEWKRVKRIIPFAVLSCLFTWIALAGKSASLRETSLLEKILMAPKSIAFTLQHFVWPSHLSILYPYMHSIRMTDVAILFPIFGCLLICVLLWWNRASTRTGIFGFGFFLIMLSPSFLNIEKGIDRYITADHYAYVPMLGLLLVFGFFLQRCLSKRLFYGCAALILLMFGFLSHTRSLLWRDNQTLYASVLARYPDSFVAHANLGLDALERGRADTALYEFTFAEHIHPTMDMQLNRGIALESLGRMEEARNTYTNMFMQYPQSADALNGIARTLESLGRTEKAIALYRTSLTLDPVLAITYNNFGSLLINHKRFSEAIAILQKGVDVHADTGDLFFNLGVAYKEVGKTTEAIHAFREAVRISPEDLEARGNLQRLLETNLQ